MIENGKIWKKFLNFLTKSIPKYIIEILIQSGYDNTISISDLQKEDIEIIENYVDRKLKHLIVNSKVYEADEKFVFLPGHEKLILALPKVLKTFENKKKRTNEIIGEEVTIFSEEELLDLKEKLLAKLNLRGKNFGLKLFTENEIVSTIDLYLSHSRSLGNNKHSNKPSYKCSVKCPECEKITPCTYNGYWQIGNIEYHLKTHKKSATKSDSSEINFKPSVTSEKQQSNEVNNNENDLVELLKL